MAQLRLISNADLNYLSKLITGEGHNQHDTRKSPTGVRCGKSVTPSFKVDNLFHASSKTSGSIIKFWFCTNYEGRENQLQLII